MSGANFNRREFLAATGTIAAGLALNTSANAAGANAGKIKKAVKYHMIAEDLTVLDKLKLLKDLGYDGVEVRTKDSIDKKALRLASEKAGLKVHGVINSSNPDIKTAVDLAKYLGGSSVLVVAGRVNAQSPYDKNYRETQARYREAAPYAQEQGIKLLVENVWNNFLLSPLETARYLDEIDNPAMGAYFDVGNVVRFGWPEQWIRILGNRIGKLDIKEYSREKQKNEGLWKGFQVEIGEGDCNWPEVRKALKEIGYSGWATAEVPGGDRKRLADIAERMNRALDL